MREIGTGKETGFVWDADKHRQKCLSVMLGYHKEKRE